MAIPTMVIHYEAKCKHCANCFKIARKTHCTKDIEPPKTIGKSETGPIIRLNDKACKDFKL